MSTASQLFSRDRLEPMEAWGMNRRILAFVHRPSTLSGLRQLLLDAAAAGTTVALRGAGCSYGDASLNHEEVVVDLTRMNRILSWDPESGTIEAEPGVTIRQLWQYCIEDGWWAPVVPGTMFVTLGGALAMNIHGKNNYKVGPIGDHVAEFDILLPDGRITTCRPDTEPELFYAAIGGFGMLGVITRIVLKMKRIYSGSLSVEAFSTGSLGKMIAQFENRSPSADYLVGWVDCFASGAELGRSLVHQAMHLQAGEDQQPSQSLRVVNQELPETLFGVVPKSLLGKMLKPLTSDSGMKAINAAKFVQGSTLGNGKTAPQSHAQFAFLLDYVPGWKNAYKPGSLIQFQSFVPEESAERIFRKQILLSQKMRIVPYLGVFKRHRPDQFLMSHAVEGYSLALDYPLTERNNGGLRLLVDRLAQDVVDAGGKFYFAKDSMLSAHHVQAALGAARIQRFRELKAECDPQSLLQSDLWRRLFGGSAVQVEEPEPASRTAIST